MERYDPARKKFVPIGNLLKGRRGHATALLPPSRLLVAGGYDWSPLGDHFEEIFDLSNNAQIKVSNIPRKAYGLTLSTLPSGKAIAVGGGDSYAVGQGHFSNLAIPLDYWIYDPATESLNSPGPCLQNIAYHTATILASGAVYLVGGIGPWGLLPSLQGLLYWPDLALLRLRFQGSGAGAVSLQPGGTAFTHNADIPLAVGLQLTLTAQPAPESYFQAWEQVPPTGTMHWAKKAPTKGHWVKSWFRRTNSFDGWGQVAPFDTNNPVQLVMDRSHSVTVNFTSHASKMGRFPPMKIPS
jgi:hypothetical protein